MKERRPTMENTAIEKREQNQNQVAIPERLDQRAYFTPLVDIMETNDAYVFQADLPGVKAGDVDISFENGVLTIEGKVQPRQDAKWNYILE
jgi:HSP20 family molecular chaperone IbpA